MENYSMASAVFLFSSDVFCQFRILTSIQNLFTSNERLFTFCFEIGYALYYYRIDSELQENQVVSIFAQ